MAKKVKDFYRILGVEKDATDDQIKKAYRRLSKVLHPDINPAEDAQEQFNEVKEAYDVLIDKELRAKYEKFSAEAENASFNPTQFHDVFDMFFGKKRSHFKAENGGNIEVNVPFTVTELVRNETKIVRINRKRICTDCNGNGTITKNKGTCTVCHGAGNKKKFTSTPFGRIQAVEDCEACKGTGRSEAESCRTCEETGTLPDDVNFSIKLDLESGITDGVTMIYKDEGHPGKNGGKNGFLIATFVHDTYDRLKIEYEYDVVGKINIDLKEALVGGDIMVVFPDGSAQPVGIPSGTQSGHKISFAGEGLYDPKRKCRGLFTVDINVTTPSNLSAADINAIVKILESQKGVQSV